MHHILNQDEESLLKSFFEQQLETRKSKDWTFQILKDLSEYKITLSMAEIGQKKEESWKKIIKEKTNQISLDYLNSKVGEAKADHTRN